jgi:hypothetical protein
MAQALVASDSPVERVRRTVALLERRGYALPAGRLGEVCLGGALGERDVLAAVAAAPDLRRSGDLVTSARLLPLAAPIAARQEQHVAAAPAYLAVAREFAVRAAARLPFVIAISIAGSLASGGFRESDDVDLNLVVEDGYRHLAYVAVNLLGLLHALRYRGKPVDDLSRRPLAPRVMTVNLVLERADCFPLARTDADMAYELLASQPVVGAGFLEAVVAANPALCESFPQLRRRPVPLAAEPARRLSRRLFPRRFEGLARRLGHAAWRYMQWTRRRRPGALARVAYVRSTMAPYALFADR